MTGISISALLLCTTFVFASAQTLRSQGCSVTPQFEPVLVSNPKAEVTFECPESTALQLIESTGRQTRIPIGIVFGQDVNALSKLRHNYKLLDVSADFALTEAVAATGYLVSKSDVGFVLVAGDLTSRQQEILSRRHSGFSGSNAMMTELGAQLSALIQSEFDSPAGYGGSILHSTNEERFTLETIPPSTVVEIANRIVTLGLKGLWILTTDPSQRKSGWTDEVEILPYQHHSNLQTADQ